MSKYIDIDINSFSIGLSEIPVLDYGSFMALVDEILKDESNHCVAYFVHPLKNTYRFFCCMGIDNEKKIRCFSHEQPAGSISLDSIAAKHYSFHIFEREIHENFGIHFKNHPWLKPVRYVYNRADRNKTINNYPFYTISGKELHEVGVGPIHAGIIEPGYFRFICNGENVLHLEIQLGYQHRGIEQLFIEKKEPLQRIILSESIAGDTAVGHSLCYALVAESLGNIKISDTLMIERIIALELERIGIHIGDTAALCTDVAYQFGQVVNEALRTIIINTTQLWCGNRFGKGLIRTGGTHYPLTKPIFQKILQNIKEVEERYLQITDRIFTLPSVLSRFENTGKVTKRQAVLIGATGMAARSSGLKRDVRWSHPFLYYKKIPYEPVVFNEGDVMSRALLRKTEVGKSITCIKELINILDDNISEKPKHIIEMKPSSFSVSLIEGWRGEICHIGITDEKGNLITYKIKDPSLHNWMALALAVRNQEISDFPLCNKSFNLSYCGNDL